eukprot:6577012-Pyramimonas_sp.AAC.1
MPPVLTGADQRRTCTTREIRTNCAFGFVRILDIVLKHAHELCVWFCPDSGHRAEACSRIVRLGLSRFWTSC